LIKGFSYIELLRKKIFKERINRKEIKESWKLTESILRIYIIYRLAGGNPSTN
jgi:hypothetical protein